MGSAKVDMKVVLLGKEYVGKTCLVCRYLHGKFSDRAAYQSKVRSKSTPTSPGELSPTMKIILLGKANTGKTSLTKRYLHNQFTGAEMTTIGAAFGAKRLIVNGKPIVMGIWDTAGSERYEAMSRIYYRGARAAVVCYDISDKSSFERVKFWVAELQKNEMDCRVYLCGTKKDLIDQSPSKRQVDYHDTVDYADKIHAQVYETSSKSGDNIEELFIKIAEDYVEDMGKPGRNIVTNDTVNLNQGQDSSRSYQRCKC